MEAKRFYIHDGMGLIFLRTAGIKLGIISGRISPMVRRRAAELKIDQPDLTFVSIVDKTWPDKSLGCANVDSDTDQEIPGFEVVFSYLNTSHVVRTNQYGSLVKTESSC